jgi:hypothetical protein
MRPYFRYFRIGWTVLCATVAMLLCVLWVRSAETYENLTVLVFQASSGRGQLAASLDTYHPIRLCSYDQQPASDGGVYVNKAVYEMMLFSRFAGFQVSAHRPTAILFPHWFAVLLVAGATSLTWLPLKRFSLRTLLIATALGCIALRLVTWLIK